MIAGLAAGLLLLVTAWTTGASAEPMAGPAPVLKYVTLNVFHGGVLSGLTGNDEDLDRRLEIVAEELSALGADIVGLQEVSTSRRRGNVAARLAARLGFHYVYAPSLFRLFASEWHNRLAAALLNFTEGPAIVSRFPIVTWEAHKLPRCGRFFDPRVLLFAELLTPWGQLPVFSTHTSGDPCHTKRVAELVRDRRGPLPAVLMGDFNAVEGSPVMTALTEETGFLDVFRAANPTASGLTVWQRVDAAEPTVRRRVDYLFLIPGTDVPGTVVGSRVVLDTPRRLAEGKVLWPSDHYGVLGEVAVFPPSSAPAAGHDDAAQPDRASGGLSQPEPLGEQDPD